MHDRAVLERSLETAIAAGLAWSPRFFRGFAPESKTAPSCKAIEAELLRGVLARCEEDESRERIERGVASGAPDCTIIARFGIKIENVEILGYLDLSGFHFKRPLIFSNCRFTHSVNVSNARLGPVSFERCRFETAPPTLEEARRRYSIDCGVAFEDGGIGFLPDRMMAAQGINAHGAHFDGYVDLTGLHAQRVEFSGARFDESLDLKGAKIHHPYLFKLGLRDNEEVLDRAIDLDAARGQHFLLENASIFGKINLTEARFASIYIIDSRIEALVQPHGSHGLAMTGRALHVESDLWFRCSPSARVDQGAKSQANIVGRLSFESATIRGDVRLSGVEIETGLSEDFRRSIADHSRRVALSRSERHAIRAISLRNCTIGGSVVVLKFEPGLSGLIEADFEHKHRANRLFHCDGEIDLRGATVDDDVRFEGCSVGNKASPRTIDLREVKVGGTLQLNGFSIDSRGIIDLRGADARSYRDDFEHLHRPALLLGFKALLTRLGGAWPSPPRSGWPRKLRFRLTGFVYKTFPIREDVGAISDIVRMPLTGGARLRWLMHQEPIFLKSKFQPQPWVQCAKVLKELGYDRQSHHLLLRREKLAMGSDDVSIGEKCVRRFFIEVCGQGHDMSRLMPIGAAMFVIALVVNTIAIQSNLMRPTNAIVLVDEAYRTHGALPANYSALNPLSFTLQSMFPLPDVVGSREWGACNWSQIRLSISQGSKGACVPRSCPISGGRVCPNLPVLLAPREGADLREHYVNADCHAAPDTGPVDLRGGDYHGRVIANVICASPELNRFFLLVPPVRDFLNNRIANGLAVFVNAFAAFVGWGIVLIVGTYAVGSLKRNE